MNEQLSIQNIIDAVFQSYEKTGVTIHINYINMKIADDGCIAHSIQESPKATFSEKMASKFNASELRGIAAKLSIDYEDVERSNKSDTIRELIGYCERRDMLSGFLSICRQERPRTTWPMIC